MIVARHEVPGKASSKEPSRRVRYDREQLIPELFLVEMCALSVFHSRSFATPIIESCLHLQESDRTLRDGSFGWLCPRHFVPGYNRTVPPGQKPFTQGLALS
jgi:hypothetical protein